MNSTCEQRAASSWKKPLLRSQCSRVVIMHSPWTPWQQGRPRISQDMCRSRELAWLWLGFLVLVQICKTFDKILSVFIWKYFIHLNSLKALIFCVNNYSNHGSLGENSFTFQIINFNKEMSCRIEKWQEKSVHFCHFQKEKNKRKKY